MDLGKGRKDRNGQSRGKEIIIRIYYVRKKLFSMKGKKSLDMMAS